MEIKNTMLRCSGTSSSYSRRVFLDFILMIILSLMTVNCNSQVDDEQYIGLTDTVYINDQLYITIGDVTDTLWLASYADCDTLTVLLLVCDTSSAYYSSYQEKTAYINGIYNTYLEEDSVKLYNHPNLFWEYGYALFYKYYNNSYNPVKFLNSNKKEYDDNYIIWNYEIIY